ncbi:MAG: glutamate--tRNA ligase [Clostridium sp.]
MEKSLKQLADLIIPDAKPIEYYEEKYMERNLDKKAKITRFAPSPTGFVHTGGLYVSLISKLIADKTNGRFLLRIEDTDQERSIENGIEEIINSMNSFDIFFDEGPNIVDGKLVEVGEYGPYIQSQRKEIYRSYAKDLIQKGLAYPCFISKEEKEKISQDQKSAKLRTGIYGKWAKYREMPIEMAIKEIQDGKPYVVRFKSQGDYNKKNKIKDLIKGTLELPEDDQDIVILKSDGLPTYHFAHAIDDHLMHVNLVIRSDEWLPSLVLHVGLFKTLGFEVPDYAHISPLQKVENGSRRKLSKRKDPEAKVSYYAEEGIPKNAVKDYLLNIANSNFEMWRKQNPKIDILEFPFALNKMGVSGALFDMVKLKDVCKTYISTLNKDELYAEILEWANNYNNEYAKLITENEELTKNILNIERENIKKPRKDISKYSEVYELTKYMYNDIFKKDPEEYEQISEFKQEKKIEILNILKQYLEIVDLKDTKEEWFDKVKQLAEKNGYAAIVKEYKQNPEKYKGHVGDIATYIRIVLTKRTNTPDLYEIIKILGKSEIENRIKQYENYAIKTSSSKH